MSSVACLCTKQWPVTSDEWREKPEWRSGFGDPCSVEERPLFFVSVHSKGFLVLCRGSVDSEGVTGEFCGSADSKEVRARRTGVERRKLKVEGGELAG